MAEHPPKKKGEVDPLLAELNESLAAPARPVISTGEAKTGDGKEVPQALQEVFLEAPSKVIEKYEQLPDEKKKAQFVENLKISQQTQAERENAKRSVRKSATPRTKSKGPRRAKAKPQQPVLQAPTGLAPELLHAVEKIETERQAERQAEIVGWNAVKPAAHVEPAVAEPTPLTSAVAPEADLAAALAQPEVAPAAGVETAARPEETRSGLEDFADEVKAMLSEKLGEEAEVTKLTIIKALSGRMLVRAELHQGMAGNIELDGALVNNGSTIGIEGLNVKSERFQNKVKSTIEENLSDFGVALKSHFEKKYGKPISGVRADESGFTFTIGFVGPAAETESVAQPDVSPEQETEPDVFRSNRKNIHNAEVVPNSQSTSMQMAEIDRIKTQLHELEGKAAIRELTTDEFADRANLELELQDYYEDEPWGIRNDGTRLKKTGKLGSLVEKFTKMTGAAKEKFDWYKNSKEGLIRRNAELDAQLEVIGGKLKIERGFRWIGEKYNKLNWKTKLAIGAGLGLGAVVTAGSLVAVLPLLGIAAQRAAGLATMYMKFEKNSHDDAWGRNKEWGKQKAMLKAGVYTVLMGLAIKEAIEYASGTELAHAAQAKVEGFLGWMMGHTASPLVASAPEVSNHTATPPTPEAPVAAPPAPEAPTEPSVTMPEVSVDAVKGKGYEYMMKRMWESLQELKSQGLDPNTYAEGSDARLLFDTDANSIDKVVHDIASNPEHNFYHADGASVRIDLDSKMTINPDGDIQIGDIVTADNDMPTTPASSEMTAQESRATLRDLIGKINRLGEDGVVLEDNSAAVLDDQAPAVETFVQPVEPVAGTTRSMPISPESPAEAPTPVVEPQSQSVEPSAETLPNVKVPEPEVDKTIDLPPEQEAVARASETVTASPDSVPIESPPAAEPPAPPLVEAPALETAEPSNIPEIGPHGFLSDNGTPINPDVANFYSSPKGVYLFGGEVSDVQAQEYAVKNNISVFVDKSFKNWLGWTTNRVVEYVPTESGPPAMVIHNGSSLVPDPKNFTKRIF